MFRQLKTTELTVPADRDEGLGELVLRGGRHVVRWVVKPTRQPGISVR